MADRATTPGSRHRARTRLPQEDQQASMLCLMSMLTHEDPRIRRRAAASLGALHDAGALDSLVMTLHDGNQRVQAAAIGALGEIGDPRAIMPLRQLHSRVGPRLRATIEEAQRSIAARQAEWP